MLCCPGSHSDVLQMDDDFNFESFPYSVGGNINRNGGLTQSSPNHSSVHADDVFFTRHIERIHIHQILLWTLSFWLGNGCCYGGDFQNKPVVSGGLNWRPFRRLCCRLGSPPYPNNSTDPLLQQSITRRKRLQYDTKLVERKCRLHSWIFYPQVAKMFPLFIKQPITLLQKYLQKFLNMWLMNWPARCPTLTPPQHTPADLSTHDLSPLTTMVPDFTLWNIYYYTEWNTWGIKGRTRSIMKWKRHMTDFQHAGDLSSNTVKDWQVIL